jgi:pyruvate kinase
MLDTKGPEIRTGVLKDHKPVELKAGQKLELTTDYSFEGDNTKVAVSYKDLP